MVVRDSTVLYRVRCLRGALVVRRAESTRVRASSSFVLSLSWRGATAWWRACSVEPGRVLLTLLAHPASMADPPASPDKQPTNQQRSASDSHSGTSQPAHVSWRVASPSSTDAGLSASGLRTSHPPSTSTGLSASGVQIPHHTGAVPLADGSTPNIGLASLRPRSGGSSNQPSTAAQVASTVARLVLPKTRSSEPASSGSPLPPAAPRITPGEATAAHEAALMQQAALEKEAALRAIKEQAAAEQAAAAQQAALSAQKQAVLAMLRTVPSSGCSVPSQLLGYQCCHLARSPLQSDVLGPTTKRAR